MFVVTASRVTLAGLDIRGGEYYGVKIDVDDHNIPTSHVTIRNCRISGSGRDCLKTFNADALLIEDCDIGPSGLRDPSNAEGIDSIGSHGVTIRRCHVHDTATNGIYLKGGATDGLVEACKVENTGHSAGILLGQSTELEFMRSGVRNEAIRCTARNNIIVNTGGSGLGTYSGAQVNFENNTLWNVAREGGAGIWIGINARRVPASKVTIRNNVIVMASTRPAVFLLNAEGFPSADYNLYWGRNGQVNFRIEIAGHVRMVELDAWRQMMRGETHSRLGVPLLDPITFQPLAGSPALDSGQKLIGVPLDFAGLSRPQGVACDIGALESRRTTRSGASDASGGSG